MLGPEMTASPQWREQAVDAVGRVFNGFVAAAVTSDREAFEVFLERLQALCMSTEHPPDEVLASIDRWGQHFVPRSSNVTVSLIHELGYLARDIAASHAR